MRIVWTRRHLVAVSMMDEPERHAPDTPFSFYQALYKDLRAHFDRDLPGVQLEISHWGPLAWWPAEAYKFFAPLYRSTDRIRLMPYPDLNEGPLSEVYYQMQRSRHIMRLAGRALPQVVILQTWALPDERKLPTIDELRVMAYQAMLVGADTISFYNYDPALWQQTPGFTEGFAALMRELTRFSHTYRAALVESCMSENGILTARLHLPCGAPVSITVNTLRSQIGDLEALAVVVTTAQQPCAESIPATRRRPACRTLVKPRLLQRIRARCRRR